eukprot:991071_1
MNDDNNMRERMDRVEQGLIRLQQTTDRRVINANATDGSTWKNVATMLFQNARDNVRFPFSIPGTLLKGLNLCVLMLELGLIRQLRLSGDPLHPLRNGFTAIVSLDYSKQFDYRLNVDRNVLNGWIRFCRFGCRKYLTCIGYNSRTFVWTSKCYNPEQLDQCDWRAAKIVIWTTHRLRRQAASNVAERAIHQVERGDSWDRPECFHMNGLNRHRNDRHVNDRHRNDRHVHRNSNRADMNPSRNDRHRNDRHRNDRHRNDRHVHRNSNRADMNPSRNDRHRNDRHRNSNRADVNTGYGRHQRVPHHSNVRRGPFYREL